jgi:sodium/hydrogen antiporter
VRLRAFEPWWQTEATFYSKRGEHEVSAEILENLFATKPGNILMSYLIIITVIGIAALGMAWMPSISQRTQVSYSVIYVAFGALLYLVFRNVLPLPDPISENETTLHLTELVVIVAIMGTGLKIDQPFSFKNWKIPFRLVIITMVLSILIVAVLGWITLGYDVATALLLGAVLAPTDPVLASDVQVGPPHEEEQHTVKFALTAEAGMNDGTAFPFILLAITIASLGMPEHANLSAWFLTDFVYRVLAAVLAGYLIGRVLAYLVFNLSEKVEYIVVRDGFIALSSTLIVYGFTEMIHGYGFIAVFITAVTMRNYELGHKFHKKLHDFTDQVERILLSIVLVLFGGSLVSGILDHLTWPLALFGVVFVFIIRPVTGFVSLIGLRLHTREKFGISFYGIKGIGSFFYLAFALTKADFPYAQQLWSLVAFIVLLSIIIHGFTATRFMDNLDKHVARKNAEANQ